MAPVRVADRQLPPCPQCGSEHVTPFAVEASKDGLLITVRCRACQHDWQIPDPGPAQPHPEES